MQPRGRSIRRPVGGEPWPGRSVVSPPPGGHRLASARPGGQHGAETPCSHPGWYLSPGHEHIRTGHSRSRNTLATRLTHRPTYHMGVDQLHRSTSSGHPRAGRQGRRSSRSASGRKDGLAGQRPDDRAAPWPSYDPGLFYDEMVTAAGEPRPAAEALWRHFTDLGPEALAERQDGRRPRDAGHRGDLHRLRGVHRGRPALAVRHHPEGHDLRRVAHGRVRAGPAAQRPQPVHRRRLPRPAVGELPGWSRPSWCPARPTSAAECVGVDPPGGIWAHICGSDLIRDADGTVYVLEDNLRVPSGVSYLLENRMVAKHVFPEMFRHYSIEPVDPYIGRLASHAGLGLPVHGRPDHRGADPGHLQLGLLRARLPGPAAGGGAGRGWRPRRPRRRLRLRPDHRRPRNGST